MKEKNRELLRAVKFVLFSISAGVIQFGITAILSLIWPEEKFSMGPMLFYLIGLLASIIYNTTVNRKFTFKSASNYTIALLKTIAFYIVFTPLSCLLQAWLTNGDIFSIWTIAHLGWHTILGTLICMVLNLLAEWPYQRFVVFRKSVDTNIKEEKEKKLHE